MRKAAKSCNTLRKMLRLSIIFGHSSVLHKKMLQTSIILRQFPTNRRKKREIDGCLQHFSLNLLV